MTEQYLITKLNKKQRVFTFIKGDSRKKPLVLLHGLGGTHMAYLNLIDKFSEKYFVYAPHIPAFGYSTAPKKFEIENYIDNLWQTLEGYGIKDKITIVGHSFGGAVATKMVLQDQERFEKLILINSAGLLDETARFRDWVFRTMEVSKKFFDDIKTDKKLLGRAWQDIFLSTARIKDTYKTAEMLTRLDMKNDFQKIKIKTSILWSQHDDYFPVEIGEKIHFAIEGSEFEIMDKEKGHGWCLVSPELVADKI